MIMYPPIVIVRIKRWVDGTTPLPERYKFGKLCSKPEHVFKGKTVRYALNSRCILCNKLRAQKFRNDHADQRDMTALDIAEEKMYEDKDPLFD